MDLSTLPISLICRDVVATRCGHLKPALGQCRRTMLPSLRCTVQKVPTAPVPPAQRLMHLHVLAEYHQKFYEKNGMMGQ